MMNSFRHSTDTSNYELNLDILYVLQLISRIVDVLVLQLTTVFTAMLAGWKAKPNHLMSSRGLQAGWKALDNKNDNPLSLYGIARPAIMVFSSNNGTKWLSAVKRFLGASGKILRLWFKPFEDKIILTSNNLLNIKYKIEILKVTFLHFFYWCDGWARFETWNWITLLIL